jgi:hypothetical protein
MQDVLLLMVALLLGRDLSVIVQAEALTPE